MTKLDLKKELRHLYQPATGAPAMVDVPPAYFLTIDGHGNPNTAPAYAAAIEALYAVAYAVKFAVKRTQELDFGVMPLEGLWWAPDLRVFTARDKDAWDWTMMIRQPDAVTADVVSEAAREVARKKLLPALDQIRFEQYDEGCAAQVLHVGPYDAEGPTIAALHDFIRARGFERRGKHHEIYLSDPRRAAPEELKTIIRQPVA